MWSSLILLHNPVRDSPSEVAALARQKPLSCNAWMMITRS
jgi:hypothetical protein